MGLQVPHVLGQNQRFAAKFESTPGTYNPPVNTDFLKVLSSDFGHKLEKQVRDDANEGLDPYEVIAMRGDLSFSIERYYTPAAAGTSPQEAALLQALLCGVPTVSPSTSVSFPLLSADPALTARALTIQRYFNADDVFFSQALKGSVINEGKFSWSGNDKPKMMFSGKAMGIIEAGRTLVNGTGSTSATIPLDTGTGRYFDASARINVGGDTNLTVSSAAADSVVLGGSITYADDDVVAPYCPTPSITAGSVLGYTTGELTYGGTSTQVTSWEINISRGLTFIEDEYGSTYMTDAMRGPRVISGKIGLHASRGMVNDLIRRRQFSSMALVIRVGSSTGRNVTHTLGQIIPQVDKLTVGASGGGTIEVPWIALASTEGAVDAHTLVYA